MSAGRKKKFLGGFFGKDKKNKDGKKTDTSVELKAVEVKEDKETKTPEQTPLEVALKKIKSINPTDSDYENFVKILLIYRAVPEAERAAVLNHELFRKVLLIIIAKFFLWNEEKKNNILDPTLAKKLINAAIMKGDLESLKAIFNNEPIQQALAHDFRKMYYATQDINDLCVAIETKRKKLSVIKKPQVKATRERLKLSLQLNTSEKINLDDLPLASASTDDLGDFSDVDDAPLPESPHTTLLKKQLTERINNSSSASFSESSHSTPEQPKRSESGSGPLTAKVPVVAPAIIETAPPPSDDPGLPPASKNIHLAEVLEVHRKISEKRHQKEEAASANEETEKLVPVQGTTEVKVEPIPLAAAIDPLTTLVEEVFNELNLAKTREKDQKLLFSANLDIIRKALDKDKLSGYKKYYDFLHFVRELPNELRDHQSLNHFNTTCLTELNYLILTVFDSKATQTTKEAALTEFNTASQNFINNLQRDTLEQNRKANRKANIIAGIVCTAAFIVGALVTGALITLLSGGTLTIPYFAALTAQTLAVGITASATGGFVAASIPFSIFQCCKQPDKTVDQQIIESQEHIVEAATTLVKR